jgi:hypothetical protein
MKAQVTLQYDPQTGEVVFLVDAEGDSTEPGHDRRHEEIASEVGRLVDIMPVVIREDADPQPAREEIPVQRVPPTVEQTPIRRAETA